jgi:hypothetical protein
MIFLFLFIFLFLLFCVLCCGSIFLIVFDCGLSCFLDLKFMSAKLTLNTILISIRTRESLKTTHKITLSNVLT